MESKQAETRWKQRLLKSEHMSMAAGSHDTFSFDFLFSFNQDLL